MKGASCKSFIIISTILAVLSGSFSYASEFNLQREIDEALLQEGLVGVAWALVDENGAISLGTSGFRDNFLQSEFTIDTRFHVGSVTKSVLATGILRLATEGLVELDTPASRYLPGLSFDNPWKEQSEVTVRHLLDHTSGLNDAQMWQMFSERPNPDDLLVNAFPEPETQLRIRTQPGTRFSYSNMGYTLLGMIIESVVGGRYEGYLDQYILVPLKMQDSTFGFTTQVGEKADPMLAWGHVDDGSGYEASPVFLRPAAQFTTTVADLARFAKFLMSDGVIEGQPFIDPALMQSRGRPSGTEAANNGLVAGYALGLGRRDRHGVVGYCHSGNIVGFVAMLCIFPDEHKAFAYSVNTDSETANYGLIDRLLIHALTIAEAVPSRSTTAASDTDAWQGRYILNPNRFQAFRYLDTVFGAIQLSADGDTLVMTSLQQEPRQLRPIGDHLYSADDRATASHVLIRADGGEFLISDGFKTYENVSTAFLFAHWSSALLGLSGLIWLLLAGLISVVRFRLNIGHRTEAPAFFAIILLAAPFPFFMAQSFMAIGDITPASVLLATVTLLLPVGMAWTIMRAIQKRNRSSVDRINGLAAALVLQWCVVLSVGGMLPLRLWV